MADDAGRVEPTGQRPHGRHVGDPADARRRATRPATNAPAHRAGPGEAAAPPAASRPAAEPVLPRSKDDLDVGWGGADANDANDDDRLLREVPPHWQ